MLHFFTYIRRKKRITNFSPSIRTRTRVCLNTLYIYAIWSSFKYRITVINTYTIVIIGLPFTHPEILYRKDCIKLLQEVSSFPRTDTLIV